MRITHCLVIIFLSLSFINSVTAVCFDSDGGINYSVAGSLFEDSNESEIADYIYENASEGCRTGSVLLEGYCNDAGHIEFIEYTCPFGCKNSICVDIEDASRWRKFLYWIKNIFN